MEISVFLYVTAPGASESLLGGISSRKGRGPTEWGGPPGSELR